MNTRILEREDGLRVGLGIPQDAPQTLLNQSAQSGLLLLRQRL
jgi:hypothetical protein